MKELKTLRERIKAERIIRDMTQHELCERAGLSETVISQFECGHRVPCLRNLIKISDALGISIDYLLGR